MNIMILIFVIVIIIVFTGLSYVFTFSGGNFNIYGLIFPIIGIVISLLLLK